MTKNIIHFVITTLFIPICRANQSHYSHMQSQRWKSYHRKRDVVMVSIIFGSTPTTIIPFWLQSAIRLFEF